VNCCEIRFKLIRIRDKEKSNYRHNYTVDSKRLIFQYTGPLARHQIYSSVHVIQWLSLPCYY